MKEIITNFEQTFLINGFQNFKTRPPILVKVKRSIKSIPVFAWYLFYRSQEDERHSQPR